MEKYWIYVTEGVGVYRRTEKTPLTAPIYTLDAIK